MTEVYSLIENQSAYVIQDSIEGGVEIRHGICSPDGSPRRYDSKSSIRKAAFEAGYFQGTDTPKVNHRIAEERAQQREAFKEQRHMVVRSR
jgi:hypothetical protein